MSHLGRPQVLDEHKKKTILALLNVGCTRRTAAGYVNCDPKTIYNTAQRDPAFAERLARAENAAEFAHLANLNKAGQELRYWRASAWVLERLFPDRFGVRSPDAISPQQLALLLNRIVEMLVEEIPVARFRKQVIFRLQQILSTDLEDDPVARLPRANPKCPPRPTADVRQTSSSQNTTILCLPHDSHAKRS